MKKRVLAAFLSLVLCIGLFPAPAVAAEEPFDPTSLTGLMAWYDAASVVKDADGNISTLMNKTGDDTYDAVQSTLSAQPLFVDSGDVKAGAPAIRLRDGDFMRVGGENGYDLDNMTIVAVLNVNALTATEGNKSNQICSRKQQGSGDHNWYFHVTSEHKANSVNFGWKEANGGWFALGQQGAGITPGETYTLIARKDGANGAMNVNGEKTAFTGGAVPQKNTAPIYLGAPDGNSDNEATLNADYAAFLIFDRGLTDAETAQLEAYLTETYLPSADPGDDVVPSDLSGLKVWYDAADLAAQGDGTKVSRWPNKAVDDTYDAVQPTADAQPVLEADSKLGAPAVRLDKTTFLEVENSFDLNNMSIFVVMNADSVEGDGDSNQIFSKLGNRDPWDHNWYFNISNKGFNYGWKDAGGFHDFGGEGRAMAADVNYILGGVKSGNEGRLYMNGYQFGTMSGGGDPVHNDQPIYIGGTGTGKSMAGVIGEILVYDRGLSAKETEQINAYVAVKFVESAGVGYISVQEIAVTAPGSEINLALGKLCASSTVSTVTDSVFAMIDGNKETRYCPPNNDKPRVLTMDLGAQADITGMKLLFEKPTDWTYRLELSPDGETWTE